MALTRTGTSRDLLAGDVDARPPRGRRVRAPLSAAQSRRNLLERLRQRVRSPEGEARTMRYLASILGLSSGSVVRGRPVVTNAPGGRA